MQKKRIIAVLTIRNGMVVQSIGFKQFLPVGKPETSVQFLNLWGIDEIILLDIDATTQKRSPDFSMVERCAGKGFVPTTVGGGIHSLDDMVHLIRCGADRISVNDIMISNPELITEASQILGSQSVVVSMDVKINAQGKYEVYADGGRRPTGVDPISYAKNAEQIGAGEILLNSIDRDGSKSGYDVKLVNSVSENVSIPVIACGGVGHPKHFEEVFSLAKVNAAAAGNYFHFTQHSSIITKAFLRKNNHDVRIDTYATYQNFDFDESGRVAKISEDYLQKLRFEYQPKDII